MLPVLLRIFLSLAVSVLSWAGPSYRLELELHPVDALWELEGKAIIAGHAPADLGALLFRFYQGYNAPFTVVSARDDEGELPVYPVDAATFGISLPLSRGQTFSVTLEYAAEIPPFPGGGYGTFSVAEDVVLLAQAYPLLLPWDEERESWTLEPILSWGDQVVAEVADYSVTVKHPPTWQVVATGEERISGSGITEVHGRNLREFAFVLIKNYTGASRMADGVGIRSWYPRGLRGAGGKALELCVEALSIYRELFGEYPFPELDVAAVPLVRAAGVEFPGLILAGIEYYRRYQTGEGELIFPMIFAHEVAHQWWYAQVGSDQVREPWVDEALATYTSGFAMANWGLYGELRAYWERTYELGRSRNPGATPFDPLWRFPEGKGYGGIVYSGGALFFLELEKAMGRERLLSALTRYLTEFRWKLATGKDLLSILVEEGGEAVEGVIRDWRRAVP